MALGLKMTIINGKPAIYGTLFSTYNFQIDMDLQNKSVVEFFFTHVCDDIFECLCNKRVKETEKKATSIS